MFKSHRRLLILLTAIVVAGVLGAWLLASAADRHMREELFSRAVVVAEAVDIGGLRVLSGTAADLDLPEYQRLKRQLEAVRAFDPGYRSIYLMGRREDGAVFFYADSEPVDSPDYSPTGGVYEDVPAQVQRALETRTSVVEGPVSDQWGTWVSALVPLIDPDTGELLAMLGMDVDADAWKWDVARRAVLPAGLAALALIAIALTGSVLLARRSRRTGRLSRLQGYLEPAVTIAAGLVLTAFLAWFVYAESSRVQARSFHQLAASRTAVLNDIFHDLSALELEGLARFYEGSDHVTAAEFRRYTGYLTVDRPVGGWEWVPAVPTSEKEDFEWRAQAEGVPGFRIWQKSADGSRLPAEGRDVYFPVLRVTPEQDNLDALGFDIGSEPVRRAAVEEALSTGLITATEPVSLVQAPEGRMGMLILRPVYSHSGREDPRGLGLVLAVLLPDETLATLGPDDQMGFDLLLDSGDGSSLLLASSQSETGASRTALTASRPVFAFGKVFFVVARCGPGFVHTSPALTTAGAALLTLLLTIAVALVVSLLTRRHQSLEALVRERTSALQESEERYRDILEVAPVAISIHQKDKVVFANPAALSLIGATSEDELVGKDVAVFVHPDHLEAGRDRIRRVLEGAGDLYPVEVEYVRLDGRTVEVEVMASRLVYHGEPAVQLLATDVTEQKRDAERLAEQLHDLQRWYSVTQEREERIMELKREVNDLLGQAGQPRRYRAVAPEDDR